MYTQITYELGNQIKTDGTDGACHKYGTEDIYIYANIWRGSLKKTGNLEERGHRLDSSGSGEEQVAGSCKCDHEHSGSI